MVHKTPSPDIEERLRKTIREVPNFPKDGINFYDITTLLKDPVLFGDVIEQFRARYQDKPIDAVVGIEARGFIFGAPLANVLKLPFIPIRKPGKLPAAVARISYSLEYDEDTLEVHEDALPEGSTVLIVDDLIATGGTIRAVISLLERLSIQVAECAFVVELSFLKPQTMVSDTPFYSLIQYES